MGALRGDRLSCEVEDTKAHPTALEVLNDPEGVLCGSGEPIELRDHERVALTNEAQSGLKLLALAYGRYALLKYLLASRGFQRSHLSLKPRLLLLSSSPSVSCQVPRRHRPSLFHRIYDIVGQYVPKIKNYLCGTVLRGSAGESLGLVLLGLSSALFD